MEILRSEGHKLLHYLIFCGILNSIKNNGCLMTVYKRENGMEKKILNENLNHDRLKNLSEAQLETLAEEIREFLIESVSKRGGHLASNLGVVELTVMLHRCFDFEKDDRLIFDVGHQSYVHKILTGRMKGFETLRMTDGLSGFPRRDEGDLFDTGHSGTSLSLADGIATAKKIKNEPGYAVAVIGDGALTGGLCYEAINNIGNSGKRVIIILNDNGMSISKNVGAISDMLMRVRTSRGYSRAKKGLKGTLFALPKAGTFFEKHIRHFKDRLKFMVLPGTFAESFGIKYIGPADGHDMHRLESYIERAKNIDGPVMIHVKTVKGKGYAYAEKQPSRFHGVTAFEVDNGETHSLKEDYSDAVGMDLSLLAAKNEKMAVICPAMTKGCGLSGFAETYPDRYFDCGIAEEHAVTFASALAEEGMVPVVCTYSTFMQRAYDEIWHDVALNGFHVVFCLDRAGLPGSNGTTHQGIYDLSYLGSIPGVAVLSPSSYAELSQMLSYAVNVHKGPIAVRYPKGSEGVPKNHGFEFGKAKVIKEGKDLTLVSEGLMLKTALSAAERSGFDVEVIELSTVYPTDFSAVKESVDKTGILLTLEANVKKGGMGEGIFATLKCKGEAAAFPDKFIEHGGTEELMERYSLSDEKIAEKIKKLCGGKNET